MKLSKIPLILTLLCFLILCSSCKPLGGASKGQDIQTNENGKAIQPNQGNQPSPTSQPVQTDKMAENYLKSVSADFEKSIEEFQVLSEDSGDDLEGITESLKMVQNSREQFQSWLENARKLSVPSQYETIASFHDSLLLYYSDSIGLMEDYEQILKYSVDLYQSLKPIEEAVEMDFGDEPSLEDVLAVVENLKKSIVKSSDAAKKCVPPHYMSYSHADYVSILTKYSGATDDLAYALMLVDPLRINASTYRYDVLANKLNVISDEMGKDIDEQQAKMNELADELRNSQEELSAQLSSLLDEFKID